MQHTTHILVLGGGYGGMSAAMHVAGKLARKQVQITLVNSTAHFVHRVRNHQLAVGQNVPCEPIPHIIRGTGIDFVQGYVTGIDPKARRVTIHSDTGDKLLSYDKMVYALGSITERDRVPGVRDHAYTLDSESLPKLADHLRRLTVGRVAVIGGGLTGIETATEIAESHPHLNVSLIMDGVFEDMLSAKGAKYLRNTFNRLHITLIDKTFVDSVTAHTVMTNKGEMLFDLVIWAGGFVANPLAQQTGFHTNERGQILTDATLRALSYSNVYVSGDAGVPQEVPGHDLTMSCYTATMMGIYVGHNLAAELHNQSLTPHYVTYTLSCISLGRHDALIQTLQPDRTPRDFVFTGRVAVYIKEQIVQYALRALRWQYYVPWMMDYIYIGGAKAKYQAQHALLKQKG